jgi:hypothetical protein
MINERKSELYLIVIKILTNLASLICHRVKLKLKSYLKRTNHQHVHVFICLCCQKDGRGLNYEIAYRWR